MGEHPKASLYRLASQKQERVDMLLADPKFVEAYEKGDVTALEEFDRTTRAAVGMPEHPQVI